MASRTRRGTCALPLIQQSESVTQLRALGDGPPRWPCAMRGWVPAPARVSGRALHTPRSADRVPGRRTTPTRRKTRFSAD
jgi:hypothetical protein